MEDKMVEPELCILAPDFHLVVWMKMYISFSQISVIWFPLPSVKANIDI